MNRAKIEREAIRFYGENNQMHKCCEECAELIKELSKAFQTINPLSPSEDIRFEIADVQIMLDQMKMIFGPTDVEEYAKLQRLAGRLGMKDE